MSKKDLASMIAKADKMAFDNGLTRKTTQVVEHKATNTLTIVEETTRFDGTHEIGQRFYRAVPLGGSIYSVQDEVNILKAEATYRSLGRLFPSESFDPIEAGVVIEQLPEATAEVATETVPRKRRTKAEMEAAKESEEPTTTAEVSPEVDPEDDLEIPVPEIKLEERVKPKTKGGKAKKKVVFDKDTIIHVRFAGEVIKDVLGKDWKEKAENKDAVRDLLFNVLHNRVNVMELGADRALPSFKRKVEEALRDKLDLAGDDDDVGGL